MITSNKIWSNRIWCNDIGKIHPFITDRWYRTVSAYWIQLDGWSPPARSSGHHRCIFVSIAWTWGGSAGGELNNVDVEDDDLEDAARDQMNDNTLERLKNYFMQNTANQIVIVINTCCLSSSMLLFKEKEQQQRSSFCIQWHQQCVQWEVPWKHFHMWTAVTVLPSACKFSWTIWHAGFFQEHLDKALFWIHKQM